MGYGYHNTEHKKARAKASRILRKKLPVGWRLRLSVKRTRHPKHIFRKGFKPYTEVRYDYHWATATKYLGPTKDHKGYPYLKLFLHPDGSRVWSLSNWADPSTAPHVSTQLALLSATEMERAFDCLEALYDMCDTRDDMKLLIGISKAKSLPDWVGSFSPAKETLEAWTTPSSSPC